MSMATFQRLVDSLEDLPDLNRVILTALASL